MNYEKELFREMRILGVPSIFPTTYITDESIVKAITINENMKAYGYCLKPNDIYRLASIGNNWMNSFYDRFLMLMDDVKAEPMYPDFPNQVMKIDEAMFRMHQMMHYFSTYGVEALFDVEVSSGWLPDVDSTEKIEDDETLLEAKVVELIDSDYIYQIPVVRILTKKERMTIPEIEILSEALPQIDLAELSDIEIPFKENLQMIFGMVADTFESQEAIPILNSICQHSGDVWRCFGSYLKKHNYKLKTSQKKMVVKLLETYSIADFEANLYLSAAKGNEIIRKLEYLSFNRFCRKPAHKEAVRRLRNNELKSWNGQVDYLLGRNMSEALSFIAQRPGMLVRLAARLIRLGADPETIADKLIERADSLSMQTLISVLNHFSLPTVNEDREDAFMIFRVMYKALRRKMELIDTPFRNKKIYIFEGDYSFENSFVDMNKSSEGGYVRSGIAYRIPEEANRIRFFVYWNDKKRIDIDLHAWARLENGDVSHVGWNSDFRTNGMVHSGDITHSDAAEYLDVDLAVATAESVTFTINSFTGVPFSNIEECFTGMMAVKEVNENVKLYNPKNCFFSHNLKSKTTSIFYGRIDIKNRVLVMNAKEEASRYGRITKEMTESPMFGLNNYLRTLAGAQNAEIVETAEDADYILVMGKPNSDNEISILDNNFFCD